MIWFIITMALLIIASTIFLCAKEFLQSYYNPLPTFANGDKEETKIKIVKSRTINFEHKDIST